MISCKIEVLPLVVGCCLPPLLPAAAAAAAPVSAAGSFTTPISPISNSRTMRETSLPPPLLGISRGAPPSRRGGEGGGVGGGGGGSAGASLRLWTCRCLTTGCVVPSPMRRRRCRRCACVFAVIAIAIVALGDCRPRRSSSSWCRRHRRHRRRHCRRRGIPCAVAIVTFLPKGGLRSCYNT
jgi:hypothetical protein